MANRPALVKTEEAARALNVPKAALVAAARRLGLLIYMGRSPRIDPNDYEELIKGCRVKPQEQGSISAPTTGFGSSGTRVVPTDQQARETAAMLKRPSLHTSQARALSPAPVTRIGSP